MNLDDLKRLAGVQDINQLNIGSNISLTGMEKIALMKKHNIKPGSQEYIKLWMSRPYLTGEKPIGD